MALPSQLYNSSSPAKMPMQATEPDDASKANAIRRRAKKSIGQPTQPDEVVNSRKQPQV